MGALEELSALCAKIAEQFGLAAEVYKQLAKEFEKQYAEYQEAFVDPIKEAVSDWRSAIEEIRSLALAVYVPRDPIPKTPYKPSYKTVIFDRRLKFPKCRSNCR